MKILFISRHDVPANLSDLLKGSDWANCPVNHIREAVDSLPISDGDLIIAICPDRLRYDWVNRVASLRLATQKHTLASLNMARVRPVEGQPTLPPTIVDSLDCLQITISPVWTCCNNTGNDIEVVMPSIKTFKIGGIN